MGKFTYAVIFVFIVEFALYLFGGTSYSHTNLFDLVFNPESMESNALYTAIILAFAAFAVSAIIPSTYIGVNVYALYAGLASILVSFGMNVAHLYTFTYGELSSILSSVSWAQIISVLITGPFLIWYLLALAEWIRGNS